MISEVLLAMFLSQLPDSNAAWPAPEKILLGHRGARAQEPENTIRSFNRAMELGANGVEFDVIMSFDGVPIIMHDDTLERTTNGTGEVKTKTLAELQKLDAGKGRNDLDDVKIPTLAETLEAMPDNAVVNIEMKGRGIFTREEFAAAVFKVMAPQRQRLFIIVSSFDSKVLGIMRNTDPTLFIGSLFWEHNAKTYWTELRDLKSVRPNSIHISAGLAKPWIIRKAHSKGLKVLVWTVNDKAQAEQLLADGVDGIFSDLPAGFL
jgi:glycerophosphoryl diester phosphodiesterase